MRNQQQSAAVRGVLPLPPSDQATLTLTNQTKTTESVREQVARSSIPRSLVNLLAASRGNHINREVCRVLLQVSVLGEREGASVPPTLATHTYTCSSQRADKQLNPTLHHRLQHRDATR